MENNNVELLSGANNLEFNDLVKDYQTIIKLLTKQNLSTGGLSSLNDEESNRLKELSSKISLKSPSQKNRYQNFFEPEQHKILQLLESKVRELRKVSRKSEKEQARQDSNS